MIRKTTAGVAQFCVRDVFGTRISGYLAAYGDTVKGVCFYVQTIGDSITAVLSDVFSTGTLCCTDQADFEELRSLISFLPLRSLLCAKDIREKLDLPVAESGAVMLCTEQPNVPQLSFLTPQCRNFEYKAVHALLTECGFTVGEYLPWLSDLAFRVQHGTANVYAVEQDGRIICTASALFQTEAAVCLGAVCTSPAYRGKGYAGSVVRTLVKKAENRRVELLCRSELVPFYNRFGFQQNGEFSL